MVRPSRSAVRANISIYGRQWKQRRIHYRFMDPRLSSSWIAGGGRKFGRLGWAFGAMLFCFVSLIINYDNEFCFLPGFGGKLWLYFMMIILYRDQIILRERTSSKARLKILLSCFRVTRNCRCLRWGIFNAEHRVISKATKGFLSFFLTTHCCSSLVVATY